jgi:hypothetical protein
MARPRLSSGRKARTPRTNSSAPAKVAPSQVQDKKAQTNANIPGLLEFTPKDIESKLPKHDDSKYQVSDPLNPPETIPQVSQQQFDKGEGIYQGAIRAVKLTGMAYDLSKERFNTLRKKVSAYGSGVKLATEIEKVRGDFLDYLTQGEINKQKDVALGVSQHKTITDTQKAGYDIEAMDEKLEQSRITSQLAKAQTVEKLSGLNEFQKQLSGK